MSDLQKAIKIVKQSNKILAKKFNTLGTKSMHFKKNQEIVTDMDMEVNKFITKKLLKYFSNDDIVSEEAKKIDNPGKDTWYIDPLDGTTNFSYGLREFGVCLAKISPKQIEVGVIGIPLANETYWAEHDDNAFLNGNKISISSTMNHGSKFMLMLCGGHKVGSQKKFVNILERMDADKIRFRVFSAASIELTAVACGRADGCIITDVLPWDVLAGVLIIRAAGGKVTNFKGEEWTIKDSSFVASNGLIHDQLLKLVK